MDDDYDDFYSPRYCSIEDLSSKYNDYNDDSDDDSDDDDDDDAEEDDNIERFKKIDGYPNYSVSTFGRIRNDTRLKNNILKPINNGKGYHLVNLYKNGKQKTHLVHRLEGLAFVPNPNNMPQVDHIDRDKTNNHISNLRREKHGRHESVFLMGHKCTARAESGQTNR